MVEKKQVLGTTGVEYRDGNPDLEELINAYSTLEKGAQELKKVRDEVVQFLNRGLYPDYSLNSGPNDPYSLKAISVPNLLKEIWSGRTYKEPLNSQADLIVKSFEDSLKLKGSTKIVAGKGMPSGDDAIYAAWQMYPEVRNNLYLIAMQTARYMDSRLFILEGGIDPFFGAESIGEMPKDLDGEYYVTPLEINSKSISLGQFGEVYRKAVREKTIKSGK